MNLLQKSHRGFSLIELMIALALGLFITGVAISIVVGNRQTFNIAENQARMMENARSAFALIARDIRAAGANPCGANRITNNLTNAGAAWWANFANNGLRGFEGSAAVDLVAAGVPVGAGGVQPLAGSDSLIILTGNLEEPTIAATHNSAAAPPSFALTSNQHSFRQGDVVMVCDGIQASIFQVTNNPLNLAIVQHDAGGGVPGNTASSLSGRSFDNGALLSHFANALWYVGPNNHGGNSLFRRSFDGRTGLESSAEIIDNIDPQNINNVIGLNIEYVERNTAVLPATLTTWINATTVTNWNFVLGGVRIEAVRITLNLRSRDNVGVSVAGVATPLTTTLSETVYLRNREYRP